MSNHQKKERRSNSPKNKPGTPIGDDDYTPLPPLNARTQTHTTKNAYTKPPVTNPT